MDLTQPILVGLLGAALLLIGLGAQFRKGPDILNSKGRNRDMWRVGGIGIGLVLLFYMGGYPGLQSLASQLQAGAVSGGGSSGGGSGGTGQASVYALASSPSVTVYATQQFKSGTSVPTTTTFLHRLQGTKAWSTGYIGTAITAYAPGQHVEFEVGNSTGTGGNYYDKHIDYTVPFQTSDQISTELAYKATAANVAIAYKNDLDQVSTAVTLGTGQTKTFYVKMTGEYQKSFGDAVCGSDSNVMVLYLGNKSQIASAVFGDYPEVTCPGIVTASTTPVNSTKCFKAPVLNSDADTGWIPVRVTGDSTNDPSTGLKFLAFDSNRYIDTITGEFMCGVNNNVNADVGIASTVAPTVYVTIS